ncbi:hypothetical protein evm_004137 [Chilo suppressalis]|nr:hypothetical protein evm_004137 [Chilo suppressalis]
MPSDKYCCVPGCRESGDPCVLQRDELPSLDFSKRSIEQKDDNLPQEQVSQPTVFVGSSQRKDGMGVSVKKNTRRLILNTKEEELRKQLIAAKIKTSKMKTKISKQTAEIKAAKKFATNPAVLDIIENCSRVAKLLMKIQWSQNKKHLKGRQFTPEQKIASLSILKQIPKGYRFLRSIFILPAPQTLIKLIQKSNIKPGLNRKIFSQISEKAAKMTREEKLCVILFDEISKKAHISFNERKDKVTGFVDNGEQRILEFADHAQVFMVRGLINNYKQAISYSFSASATKGPELAKQIKMIITQLHEAGLIPLASVCDQGTNNRSAINILLNEARGIYLRRGETPKNNTIIINDAEIIPLYDPPHLLKGMRNNLLTKILKYTQDDGHPEKINKMKVKFASQIFSRTVASNMGYLAEKGVLPSDDIETADLLLLMDNLFHSVNGSFKKNKWAKPLLGPATPNSAHHKIWAEAKKIFNSIKLINVSGQEETVPTVTNWVWTLEGIEILLKKLKNDFNISSVWLRHLNQDPLEIFFGAIRSHGCRNTNPTSEQFESAFATLLINNLNSVQTRGKNCEGDFCDALHALIVDDDAEETSTSITNVDFENIININFTPLDEKQNNPRKLKDILGHTPNARPFNTGVRFSPKSENEFRATQRYLVEASTANAEIVWYCYAPQTDLPTKVAIRGIPADTDPLAITEALEERGFPVTFVRSIRGKSGRPGCIYHAQFDHLPQDELARLYSTDELLGMPGVTIEAWKPRAGPAQCHRCQAFGHSSLNCHRPKKCVRCAGDHSAADCPRSESTPPSCANCGKSHAANDRRCKVFLAAARRSNQRVQPPIPGVPHPGQQPPSTREPHQLPPVNTRETQAGPTLAALNSFSLLGEKRTPVLKGRAFGVCPRMPEDWGVPTESRTPTDGTSPSPSPTNDGSPTSALEAQRPTSPSNPISTPSGPDNQAYPQTGVPTPSSSTTTKSPDGNHPRPTTQKTSTSTPSPPSTTANVDSNFHSQPSDGGHRQGNGSHPGDNGSPELAAPGGHQHKALRIIYWNPGGIRRHLDELRLLSTEQDAHIILLGETLLSDKHKLKIPNFTTYRRDEATPYGTPFRGTAALVRRDIVHDELPWLPFKSTRTIGVRTKTGDKDLKIYAAYKPPQTQVQETDIDSIFSDDVPTILAGDLNCKHSAFEAVGPPDATHIPSDPLKSPDTIDIVLHKNISSPVSVEVLYSTSTQHLPILICLNLDPNAVPPAPPKYKTDWEAYTRDLSEYKLPLPLTTHQEIDANIKHLVQAMRDARERHSSRTTTQRRDPLPLSLQQKMAEKKRMKKLWATTRCPHTKTRLNQITAEVASGVKKWRGDSWSATIDKATDSKPGLYKLLRGLTKQAQPVCPLLDEGNRSRYEALDRATIFADHLQAQFTPHPAAQEAADHHRKIEDQSLFSPPPPSNLPTYHLAGSATYIDRRRDQPGSATPVVRPLGGVRPPLQRDRPGRAATRLLDRHRDATGARLYPTKPATRPKSTLDRSSLKTVNCACVCEQ